VRVIRLPDGSSHNQQSRAVLNEIKRLCKIDSDVTRNDIAILARQNKYLQPLQAWCEQKGVPYFLSSDKSKRTALYKLRQFDRLQDAFITAANTGKAGTD